MIDVCQIGPYTLNLSSKGASLMTRLLSWKNDLQFDQLTNPIVRRVVETMWMLALNPCTPSSCSASSAVQPPKALDGLLGGADVIEDKPLEKREEKHGCGINLGNKALSKACALQGGQ